MVRLGELWKSMTAEQQSPYKDRARVMLDIFQYEHSINYNQSQEWPITHSPREKSHNNNESSCIASIEKKSQLPSIFDLISGTTLKQSSSSPLFSDIPKPRCEAILIENIQAPFLVSPTPKMSVYHCDILLPPIFYPTNFVHSL